MTATPKPEKTTSAETAVQHPSHRVWQISPSNVEGLDRVTALHMELLDFGPMAQFGDHFIREMCYAVPLHDGLLHLALAEVDDRPAGFIAYTDQAQTFHRSLFRNHFFEAGWILGISLLRQPRRLLRLPRAVRVVLSRDDLPDTVEDTQAEVVSFAVQPEFLSPAFVRRTGLRVSSLLLDHAFDHFRGAGFTRVRMIVDADNRRALLFYHSLGASFTPCTYGGVPSVLVSIDL